MIDLPVRRLYRKLFNPGLLRRLQADSRALPDFVVIGAMRAGTTSLYEYITRHPKVAKACKKEVHYFDLFHDNGLDWYRAHFPLKSTLHRSAMLTGEASPYYIFHPLSPVRVAAIVPGVKLIAILRNPVDRAYSHYWHSVRLKAENLSFEEAIDIEGERLAGEEDKLIHEPGSTSFAHLHFSYLSRSIYSKQIRCWLDSFNREQVIVLEQRTFFKDLENQSGRLFDFLGLAPAKIALGKKMNKSQYPEMKQQTRMHLLKKFEPHNAALFELLGESFDWQD